MPASAQASNSAQVAVMWMPRVLSRALSLQHADAIQHCIDAGEQRPPGGGRIEPRHIGRDPLHIGKRPPRRRDVAPDADNRMTVPQQPRGAGRPDQAIGAGDQNAHAPREAAAVSCRISPGSPSR
jgi:hypothetical protein